MTDLVYTVQHSGSHSLRHFLGDGETNIQHCDNMEIDLGQFDQVHTTMRCPLRVGASWANRYGMPLDEVPHVNLFDRWKAQWSRWSEVVCNGLVAVHLVETLPEGSNSYKDRLGMHRALDENNMDYYHQYVPVKYILFAQECVGKTNG